MNLLKQYNEAKAKRTKLFKEKKSLMSDTVEKRHKVVLKYRDQIHALEYARDEEEFAIQRDTDRKITKNEEEQGLLQPVIDRVDNILKMMVFIKEGRTEKEKVEVYRYGQRTNNGKEFFEPIKTLLDDKYNTINLYVVPNGKPVKEFSLIIRGTSIFNELLDSSYEYINRIHDNCCLRIRITVKDAETQQELIDYANKPRNMKRIMSMIPDLDTFAKDFEKAQNLLQNKEWQVAYLLNRKDYYERNYSGLEGEDTPEYDQILKDLKKLT
jgi:hypothetical protein